MLRDHVPSYWGFLFLSLMPCLVNRQLAPEGKLAASKRGEEFMPWGSMHWKRVATVLGKSMYLEKKMAFQQQWARCPHRQICLSKGLTLSLSRPPDGPSSPHCQSKMGQERQRKGEKKLLFSLLL